MPERRFRSIARPALCKFDMEFMKPLGLSTSKLVLGLRVPATWIAEIVGQHRGITVDTAPRLAPYIRNSPTFWLNLQMPYELEVAEDSHETEKIACDVHSFETAARGVTDQ